MDIRLNARKAVGCVALALAALALTGAATKPAQAQTYWEASDIGTASDGTSRVLWTADTPNGEVAAIWKMDANGNKVASGSVYGPYQDTNGNAWVPEEFIVMPNGTSHLTWQARSTAGTEEVIWTFDTNGNATSTGTVYGPFSDSNGKWTPRELLPASDGTLRQLWVNTNNDDGDGNSVEAIIWTLNASGARTGNSQVYGPLYNGSAAWHPIELNIAPDNSLRMLWVAYGSGVRYEPGYGGDTTIIWRLDTGGNRTGNGPVYGPYAGWLAANFSINPSDSTLRVLWKQVGTYDDDDNDTYSGDVAGLWSFDTNGNETVIGKTYGPYAGWSAEGVIALPDGTSRVEWDNDSTNSQTNATEDQIGLWAFNSSDVETSAGPSYGPYDGWGAYGTSINTSDYTFRVLWTRDDGAAGIWAFSKNDVETSTGSVYGPFTY